MSDRLIKRVRRDATGYTVMAERIDIEELDDEEAQAMKRVGFSDEAIIYTVLTDGDVLGCHYDAYEVARQVDESWMVDTLKRLKNALKREA